MQVAVVGTGISGNAAAWTYQINIQCRHDRELRPGGHSHRQHRMTVRGFTVDSGFIVYNELNYRT